MLLLCAYHNDLSMDVQLTVKCLDRYECGRVSRNEWLWKMVPFVKSKALCSYYGCVGSEVAAMKGIQFNVPG